MRLARSCNFLLVIPFIFPILFSPLHLDTKLLLAYAGGTRGSVVLWDIDTESPPGEDAAMYKMDYHMPAVSRPSAIT